MATGTKSPRRAKGEGSVYLDTTGGHRSRIEQPDGTVTLGDPKPRWIARVQLPDGSYRKAVCASERAAKAKLRELRREADAIADGRAVKDRTTTVASAAERYYATKLKGRRGKGGRPIAPTTAELDRTWIAHIISGLGSRRLREVTQEHVEDWLRDLADGDDERDGLAYATIAKVRNMLVKVLEDAIARGWAVRNVARNASVPNDAAEPRARRALTSAELAALLEACADNPHGAIFEFLAATGCRSGEAAGVKWDAVDFDAGTVTFRSGRRLNERGGAVLVDDLKTVASRRTIKLSPAALAALQRAAREQADAMTHRGWREHGLVFPTRVGTPLGGSALRKRLTTIAAAAGIGELGPHELRHTFASHLADRGYTVDEIAGYLGNSPEVVARVYVKAVRTVVHTAGAVDLASPAAV